MSIPQLEEPFITGVYSTVLVEVVAYDPLHQQHQLRSALKGTAINFAGIIPKDVTVLLLVNVMVSQVTPQVKMYADHLSRGIPRSTVNMESIKHVVELCAGMGCPGWGLYESGFQIDLRCDSNPHMLQLASRIDSAATLQGDIAKSSLIAFAVLGGSIHQRAC